MAKHIIQRFHHRVLFSHTKRDGNIPTGTPNGGVERKGYEKIAIFGRFISDMKQDRAIVTMEGE